MDKLKHKLMNSRKFKKLSPQEKMIELQDYDYQKKNFKKEVDNND